MNASGPPRRRPRTPAGPTAGAAHRPGGAKRRLLSPGGLLALHIIFLARKQDLLELDARRRVFETVRDYPGLHLRALARETDLGVKHVEYHLRRLEQSGLVSARDEDRYRCFYPREEGSVGRREVVGREQKRALSMLRRPVPLHIVVLLLDRTEMTHKQLLEHVDVAHGTLSYHLKKLEKDGIIETQKAGRERRLRLRDADEIEGLLMRFKPPDRVVQGFIEAWDGLGL